LVLCVEMTINASALSALTAEPAVSERIGYVGFLFADSFITYNCSKDNFLYGYR
jgi:hypothetical protein